MKKILLSTLLACMALTLSAQESQTTFFIGAGAGMNFGFDGFKFNDRPTSHNGAGYAGDFYLGAWLNEGLGLRAGYQGFGISDRYTDFGNRSYSYVHGDLMFRPHKNIIPYLHAGHVKILDGSWGTGLGVMVPIHLNSRLTIVPDVKATGYSSRTYGAADNNVALTLSATVGIAVNLGKARKSPEAAPAPVVVSEPERIAQPQPYRGGRDTVIIREYYREVVVRDTVYVTPEVGHPDTVGAMALFDTDSDVIRPEAYPDLDKVAEWFQKHPKAHATIEGHTDSTASAQYNQGLSERRAMAVYMYLVRKGISPNRLTFVGYGLTRPIDTNATETGRQRNRRVEIKVEE